MSELTIQELMQLDPFQLTDQDFEKIVQYYRDQRHTYNTTGIAPRRKPVSKMPKIDLGGIKL